MRFDDEDIVRMLDQLPPEEPPTDLRSGIMNGLKSDSNVVDIRSARRSKFIYVWAAAAALVAGFFLFNRSRQDRPDNVFATMAPVVSRLQSDKLTLVVRRRYDHLILQPEVNAAGSVSIHWDPNVATLVAISGATDASSSRDQTTFSVRDPSQHVAVALRAPAATEVAVSFDDKEVIRATVPAQ